MFHALHALASDIRDVLVEQVEYRELLVQMTFRDLVLRYKQAVMGFGWAVFVPLINTAVFSVIFVRVAPLDTGMPYPLFAYCGLLAWNFFASSLRFAVTSLTSNVNLVTKVYFPREVFPLSAVIVSLVDLAVGASLLLALMIYYKTAVSTAVLFLPVVILVHIVFTAAIALVLAMANLFYRDVKYLFEAAISVWMFATSVVYPLDRVHGRLTTVLHANPMTPIIDAYRSVLLRGALPAAGPFLGAAVVSVVLLAVACVIFHRSEFKFAENI